MRCYYTIILSFFLQICFTVSLYSQDIVFKGNVINQKITPSLDSIFEEYNIFSFDVTVVKDALSLRSADQDFGFYISPEMNWTFRLNETSVLSDKTELYTITAEGKLKFNSTQNVKTYEGVFSDGRDGFIRLTLSDDLIYAYIQDEDDEFFIEPYSYFDPQSRAAHFVIYSKDQVRPEHSTYYCNKHFTRPEGMGDQMDGDRSAGACYKVKLALLADYSMFTDPAHPGIEGVIFHLASVLNNVQALYTYNGNTNFNDGIYFEIGEIVIATCAACDPLSGQVSPLGLLTEFSSWVDNGGFLHPFNAAYFWTNRDLESNTIAIAFQASNLFCNSFARAVFEDYTTNAALLRTMVAHEIGHNFNGVHDSQSGFILSPAITSTSTWSANSKSTISTQIANQGPACLPDCTPTLCERVKDIFVSAVTAVNFTLSWSHTAQSAYRIRVRNLGESNFILDINTTSNSLLLQPPGYAICKKYEIFVYNNCGGSGLSAAEVVLMTSPESQGCADFTLDKSIGWAYTTVQFTDKSKNASSWLWNFGNGSTSTLQNPAYTFPTHGAYNVSLTINGLHTKIINKAIVVLPAMAPPFLPADGGNFEVNPDYFAPDILEGSVNLWQRGLSSYKLTTSGGNAWKTLLNANIPKITAKSALYTPMFNFTGHAEYILSFNMGMNVVYCNAPLAVQLQYSVNSGNSWSRLGSYGDVGYGINGWYNYGPGHPSCQIATQVFSDRTGWAFGTSANGLNNQFKSYDVSFLAGIPEVLFRFVFSVSGLFNDGYDVDGVLIDNFRIDAQNPVVLPIQANSLQAIKVNNSTAKVSWSAISTSDISHFMLQKSKNGHSFFDVETIYLSNKEEKDFYYMDENPWEGLNYYRIKSKSPDEHISFSNIDYLNFESESSVTLYPNPLTKEGKLILKTNDNLIKIIEVMIYDNLGNQILKNKIDQTEAELDLSALLSGMFVLHIMDSNGNISRHKLIKAF